jgi:hypothetical protein
VTPELESQWSVPRPEHLARPTWSPAALGLGITLTTWGLIVSPIVVAIGLLVFVAALARWIGDLRHG